MLLFDPNGTIYSLTARMATADVRLITGLGAKTYDVAIIGIPTPLSGQELMKPYMEVLR